MKNLPRQAFGFHVRSAVDHNDVGKAFSEARPDQRAIMLNCAVNWLERHVGEFGPDHPGSQMSHHIREMEPHLNQNTIEFLREIVDHHSDSVGFG